MASERYINTEKFSSVLRLKGIEEDSKRILITNFLNSDESKDFTLPPNCGGWGRIHHFFRQKNSRWLPNPLPIDPATHALNLPHADKVEVQVFQNAICTWRCWYCFVDYSLLSGNMKYSGFKTADELIDLYLAEANRCPVIDLSGGQPDLVPEFSLWFADAIKDKGLDGTIYLWSDDNLSNDYLWRYLKRDEIIRLAAYRNYGRVGCFKGFDNLSFSFNTHAAPELFPIQFSLMHRLVSAGFDVYGYATFTADSDKGILARMSDFVDQLQEKVHANFPLRTVPLQIFEFTPTRQRMDSNHHRALEIQYVAKQAWEEELTKRFSQEELKKLIWEHKLS